MNFKTPVMLQGGKNTRDILLVLRMSLNLHLGFCLFIVIHSFYIMNRLEQNK